MTSGRGKDRSDLERTTCINATRTDCGTKLRAATCHAPGLGTAQVTRFTAGADEPYEGILHVRVCGGRRGQPRLLPGRQPDFASRFCLRVSLCSCFLRRCLSLVVRLHASCEEETRHIHCRCRHLGRCRDDSESPTCPVESRRL